ncbi:response regulator, partial [Lysinibacillus capsici]
MANILVVDDEVDILMLIKNALYKDNHLVTIVSKPTEVGKMDLGSFDLILLDVMMPIMDGFTLCGQIRHAVDCPILFLTAKSLEEDVMYGLGLGADDY